MISMDKKYTTRDGRGVRLLCVDVPGEFPVVGIVRGDIFRWNTCGGFAASGISHDFDLIEAPETIEVDVWVNVYAKGGASLYRCRQDADNSVKQYTPPTHRLYQHQADYNRWGGALGLLTQALRCCNLGALSFVRVKTCLSWQIRGMKRSRGGFLRESLKKKRILTPVIRQTVHGGRAQSCCKPVQALTSA